MRIGFFNNRACNSAAYQSNISIFLLHRHFTETIKRENAEGNFLLFLHTRPVTYKLLDSNISSNNTLSECIREPIFKILNKLDKKKVVRYFNCTYFHFSICEIFKKEKKQFYFLTSSCNEKKSLTKFIREQTRVKCCTNFPREIAID